MKFFWPDFSQRARDACEATRRRNPPFLGVTLRRRRDGLVRDGDVWAAQGGVGDYD
jgi:hypothetical protein